MIEQLNKERDNYISLLERTREALVQKIQKQIDKESKIVEAISCHEKYLQQLGNFRR